MMTMTPGHVNYCTGRGTRGFTTCRTDVHVHGRNANAIIDSGSAYTVVTRHFLRKHGLLKTVQPINTRLHPSHVGRNEVSGMVPNIMLTIAGYTLPTDVLVSESRTYDVLIGNDYLLPARAILCYGTGQIGIEHDDKTYQWVPLRVKRTNRDADGRYLPA